MLKGKKSNGEQAVDWRERRLAVWLKGTNEEVTVSLKSVFSKAALQWNVLEFKFLFILPLNGISQMVNYRPQNQKNIYI